MSHQQPREPLGLGLKGAAAEAGRRWAVVSTVLYGFMLAGFTSCFSCLHLTYCSSADELALVLDDTEVVWPGHRRNLLQVMSVVGLPCARPVGLPVPGWVLLAVLADVVV